MGGYGSGRWNGYATRDTVEISKKLRPKDVRAASGIIYFTYGTEEDSQPSGSLGFRRITGGVMLEYTWDKREAIREPVRVERGRVGFMDGEWFLCPLLKPNGAPCNRPCRILCCPPGQKYFGCRVCYNLTYYSCNESHKYDRSPYFLRLAAEVGMTASELNGVFSDRPKKRRTS